MNVQDKKHVIHYILGVETGTLPTHFVTVIFKVINGNNCPILLH